MKVLLVNDNGQMVACMENVEQYDAAQPGDLLALMDFLEQLIATATGSARRRKRTEECRP